jgi:hypothetical protein
VSRVLAALSAVMLIGLLAGCSGGDGASSSAAPADNAAGGAAGDQNAAGASRAADNSSVDSVQPAASAPSAFAPGRGRPAPGLAELTPRALIKTAAVSLQARDVSKVLQEISDATVLANGEVASEETTTNRHGQPVHSRLVLRVPVDNFESTLTKISSLGRLKSLARSVDDVTTAVADINSRVQSAQDSIAQLRRLFSSAQRLGQIIQLESELSQREADLEALQAQQRALADQTAMSTLTVTLTAPPHRTLTPPADKQSGGFVAGLKSGWHALGVFVGTTSRVVGVLLPFAVVGLLVFGVGWVVVRRVRPPAHPRPSE